MHLNDTESALVSALAGQIATLTAQLSLLQSTQRTQIAILRDCYGMKEGSVLVRAPDGSYIFTEPPASETDD